MPFDHCVFALLCRSSSDEETTTKTFTGMNMFALVAIQEFEKEPNPVRVGMAKHFCRSRDVIWSVSWQIK
jgi:hypothetical protein